MSRMLIPSILWPGDVQLHCASLERARVGPHPRSLARIQEGVMRHPGLTAVAVLWLDCHGLR